MNDSTEDRLRPDFREPSTGELIKQLSEQVSTLLRDELKLAQLEMSRKGRQAGAGVSLLGGAGLISLYGLGCLIACAIIAISGVLRPWLAALIAGAVLLAIAGIAALIGKARLSRATPPMPRETAESLKVDVEVIKEKVKR